MSTKIRPEVSTRNRYWINKHRYYELKHHCLQYPIWKRTYEAIDGLSNQNPMVEGVQISDICDSTYECARLKIMYAEKMALLERLARETDEELANYILQAVTEGLSYAYFKSRLEIPCSKDLYYDRYRKFFWLLSRARE